tara:strand:+ start:113 stop:430 length:318 start_codon:yes stop_codon:yes gene_type:complete
MNKNHIIPTLGKSSSPIKKEPQSQLGVAQFLNTLAEVRLKNEITLEKVMENLNFSRSTLKALEEGNLEFIQYPLNYFFTRQYAQYLKVPFPEQYIMSHFKPTVKK